MVQDSDLVQTHSPVSGLSKFLPINFVEGGFILDQALLVCSTQTVCQILCLCSGDNLSKKSLELILYSVLAEMCLVGNI